MRELDRKTTVDSLRISGVPDNLSDSPDSQASEANRHRRRDACSLHVVLDDDKVSLNNRLDAVSFSEKSWSINAETQHLQGDAKALGDAHDM